MTTPEQVARARQWWKESFHTIESPDGTIEERMILALAAYRAETERALLDLAAQDDFCYECGGRQREIQKVCDSLRLTPEPPVQSPNTSRAAIP